MFTELSGLDGLKQRGSFASCWFHINNVRDVFVCLFTFNIFIRTQRHRFVQCNADTLENKSTREGDF